MSVRLLECEIQRENHYERNKTEIKGHQNVAKKQRKQARWIVNPEILTEKDNFDIEMENMVKTDKWYARKFDMLTKIRTHKQIQNDLQIPRAGQLFVQ